MMTTGPTNDATGTFHAAGCRLLQPGTPGAYGDRNPVPDGVERPLPHGNVPECAERTCPRRHIPAGVARPTPPTTKTYKYYCFAKPFNIREL